MADERSVQTAGASGRICVTTEAHLFVASDGTIHTSGSEDYVFFSRYLVVFDEVAVVARCSSSAPDTEYSRVDGPGVSIVRLPEFSRLPFLRVWRTLVSVFDEARSTRAWVLRLPGVTAIAVWLILVLTRRPYAVELVGDPEENWRYSASRSRLLSLARPLATLLLKVQVRGAIACAYVTKEVLQERYPCGGWSTWYSSVEVPEDSSCFSAALRSRLREEPNCVTPLRVVFVGRLNRPLKGLDTLLVAASGLIHEGKEIQVTVIGGGHMLPEYAAQAERLGIEAAVSFVGEVAGAAAVQEYFAEQHLFVLPSRGEGLSRALLEAMSSGLPCLATPVGGMREVLRDCDLFGVGDAEELRRKMDEFRASRSRRCDAAEHNSRIATMFNSSELDRRRADLYTRIRTHTIKDQEG